MHPHRPPVSAHGDPTHSASASTDAGWHSSSPSDSDTPYASSSSSVYSSSSPPNSGAEGVQRPAPLQQPPPSNSRLHSGLAAEPAPLGSGPAPSPPARRPHPAMQVFPLPPSARNVAAGGTNDPLSLDTLASEVGSALSSAHTNGGNGDWNGACTPTGSIDEAPTPLASLDGAHLHRRSSTGASLLQHPLSSLDSEDTPRDTVSSWGGMGSGPSSSGSGPSSSKRRRFVRVSKKRPGTWMDEVRAFLTSVYGYPSLKTSFVGKVLLTLLLGWMLLSAIMRPQRSHQAQVSALAHAVASGDRALVAPPVPAYTAADVTIFTVHMPESDALASASASTSPERHVHVRAMYSWVRQVPRPEQVLVFVRDYAHCAPLHAAALGVNCRVSHCWDEQFGAPRLPCVLAEAEAKANTPLMLYADDHLVLFDDALPALLRLSTLDRFLMTGRSQRMKLNLDPSLDLESWQSDLESAVFLDSSAEQERDLLGQHLLEGSAQVDEVSKSLHYLAWQRGQMSFASLPPVLMGSPGSVAAHGWESAFLATVLVQDSVHVVDCSEAVTAVEFGHRHATPDVSEKLAQLNAHNTALAANWTGQSSLHPTTRAAPLLEHLSLGRLENAHYVLNGRCPTCALKENREADLPLILLRVADVQRRVVVVATNADYLALTFNFLCRAERLGVANVVLLAEDRVSYRILRKMGRAVVLRKDAPYRKRAAPVGSKAWQETLYLRALFFQQVVSLGFSLLYSHLDSVWLQNPFSLLESQVPKEGGECDMWVQMEKATRATGGLLGIRANPVGQSFAQDYLQCEQENWNFIQKHGKPRFSYSDDVDIDCVELISTRLMRRSSLHRCTLDPNRFVSEGAFFDHQTPQRLGVWPAFVHLNSASGVANKTAAFTGWHLWSVDDDRMVREPVPILSDAATHGVLHCVSDPAPVPAPSSSVAVSGLTPPIRVQVHLLVGWETKRAELTLLSLSSASYDAHTTIDLTVALQPPPGGLESASPEQREGYTRTRELLDSFSWRHGSLSLTLLDEWTGASDRWLDSWTLHADNEALILALEAGQVLSPSWATWTRRAVERYFLDPFAFDAQLMGLSLAHPLKILGETPWLRYGSRTPATALRNMIDKENTLAREAAEQAAINSTIPFVPPTPAPVPSLYLYQHAELTGTVFFPRHFARFLVWYASQNVSDTHAACVPTLRSNTWWIERPETNWSAWLTRFVFESGWYVLASNWAQTDSETGASVPRALLVDDQTGAASLAVSLVKKLEDSDDLSSFPSRPSLRLFDFHFAPVSDPTLLPRRKFVFPPLPSSSSMATHAAVEEFLHQRGDVANEDGMLTGHLALVNRAPLVQRTAEHDAAHCKESEPEQDRSHLDVMIEAMIRQMGSASGGVDGEPWGGEQGGEEVVLKEGRPDLSTLRTLASQRRSAAQNRATRLSAHRAHHTLPIRGRELDRCFVQEDRFTEEEERDAETAALLAQTPKESCKGCFSLHPGVRSAIEARIAAKVAAAKAAGKSTPEPEPLAAYLTVQSIDAAELYKLMWTLAQDRMPAPGVPLEDRNPPVKFVVYQPTKAVPFDGHLRGMYFTFILALLTNRIMLVDLPDMHAMYECPFEGVSWNYRDFADRIANAKTDVFDNKRAAELRTANLDQMYFRGVLVHSEGVTHDRVLFKNVLYKSAARALFGSSSRMKRTGAITQLLLSRPRPALLSAASALSTQLGLTHPEKTTMAVHAVVPATHIKKAVKASDPLPGVEGRYWRCVHSLLLSLNMDPSRVTIFWSTNRPSAQATLLAQRELGRFGSVVTNPLAHANYSVGGVSSATESSVRLHDASGAPVLDPQLVSGYLLGDANVSISAGTTYGIFYSARSGFKQTALIAKLAPPRKKGAPWEEDYCGPMHRLDQPYTEDIQY